jgi:hypothetical protein
LLGHVPPPPKLAKPPAALKYLTPMSPEERAVKARMRRRKAKADEL